MSKLDIHCWTRSLAALGFRVTGRLYSKSVTKLIYRAVSGLKEIQPGDLRSCKVICTWPHQLEEYNKLVVMMLPNFSCRVWEITKHKILTSIVV